MLTSENISRPQLWVAYEPSAAVIAAVTALESDREALYKAQVQHGVQAPLAVDLRLAGMLCIMFCWCIMFSGVPCLLGCDVLLVHHVFWGIMFAGHHVCWDIMFARVSCVLLHHVC